MLPGKMSSEGKKKKHKSGISQCLTLEEHPGVLPCNQSLPAEAWSGVWTFPQSPDGKYAVSSQATGRAFQQSWGKHQGKP